MKLLLDTHTLIWISLDPGRINPQTLSTMKDPMNEIYFSAVSTWEMAIKIRIGKMEVPGGLALFVAKALEEIAASPLSVTLAHTLLLESLPLHHSDPFDRLLVSQCLFENMPIISIDAKLDAYGVTRIW